MLNWMGEGHRNKYICISPQNNRRWWKRWTVGRKDEGGWRDRWRGKTATSCSFSSSTLWGLGWVCRLRQFPPSYFSHSLSLPLLQSFSLIPLNRVFRRLPIKLLAISPVGFNLWCGCSDVLPTLFLRLVSMPASWQGFPPGRVFFSV